MPALALEREESAVVMRVERCFRGDPATQPALAALHSALHQEIEAFCLHIMGEMRARKPYQLAAISKVTKAMQVLWPRSRVSVFGSNATGLALPTSDVDILVHLPPVRNLEPIKEAGILEGRNGIKETCLQHASRYLADQDWVKSDTIKTIENAMVPIVMLTARLPAQVRRVGSGGSDLTDASSALDEECLTGPPPSPAHDMAFLGRTSPGRSTLQKPGESQPLVTPPPSAASVTSVTSMTSVNSETEPLGHTGSVGSQGSSSSTGTSLAGGVPMPAAADTLLSSDVAEDGGCPPLPPRGPWGSVEERRQVRLDISFEGGSHSGLQTAELVRELTQQFPAMPPLALVLKQFLTDRSLDHPFTGGLSSYCLVLLITRFLQDQPHLGRPPQWQNLGSLLLDFLHFFGTIFDPRRMCTSVRQGGMFLERNQSIDPLSIEDPLDPSNNVGRNCFRILQCTKAFAEAYAMLESQLPTLEADIQDGSPLCGTQLLSKIIPSIAPS